MRNTDQTKLLNPGGRSLDGACPGQSHVPEITDVIARTDSRVENGYGKDHIYYTRRILFIPSFDLSLERSSPSIDKVRNGAREVELRDLKSPQVQTCMEHSNTRFERGKTHRPASRSSRAERHKELN